MKRKLSLFSCLCLFFFVIFSSKAQEIAPFQWDDTFALEIDNTVLQKLLNTKWVCVQRKFTSRGNVRLDESLNSYISLKEDGICTHNGFEGAWFVEESNLLVMDYKPEYMNKEKMYIAGGFSVYKISDEELIIAKCLTSSYDNKIVYYFRPENEQEKLAVLERERVNRWREKKKQEMDPGMSEKEKQDKLAELSTIEARKIMLEGMTREEVIGELKAEAFMHGYKIKENLEVMTREELITFYLEILFK